MLPSELIVDLNTFQDLRAQCDALVDTGKRLPDFVFQRRFDRYFAVQHALMSKEVFGVFLSSLAKHYGDQLVNYMSIEPDPVSEYFDKLSFFGMARFRAEDVATRYLTVMSNEGRGDSFLVWGGDVGVFWGTSRLWAIVCDRVSWELIVVGLTGGTEMIEFGGVHCMDATELSRYLESEYHWKLSVAHDFMQKFLSNYTI
jgi:hypothetical protein